ncbi:hypothetical protein WICPIJ_006056 [Wickerhamomyces pijperi]|uniref:F-box domain-containing protein n=1 Tax=Wickerhamomyces pijperi TaxID=599730 RepID=A0A9P8TLC0_WICPI|nr:hypothetical protein WICPIJ_006056 [Wickerhamomyces pijperi]
MNGPVITSVLHSYFKTTMTMSPLGITELPPELNFAVLSQLHPQDLITILTDKQLRCQFQNSSKSLNKSHKVMTLDLNNCLAASLRCRSRSILY